MPRPSHRWWWLVRWLLACLALVVGGHGAAAQTPLRSQTLALPRGPSGLKGLGESFSVQAATGTGHFSVPLQLPPGRVAPSLSLQYAGGSGKGIVGFNWSLPLLQIYRATDKGAPQGTQSDRFAVRGPAANEELVLVNPKLRYYRLKNEGAFALFVHSPASDSWSVRFPNGETAYLGESQQSREQRLGRTHHWYIERRVDRFAHEARYEYRFDGGKLYPAQIRYQLHAPAAEQNTVRFEYERRFNAYSDFRYRDETRVKLRLQAIVVEHGPRQVARYRLGYERRDLFDLLSSVEMEGEEGLSMPPVRFEYLKNSRFSGRFISPRNLPPVQPIVDGRAQFLDVNADALPDLVYSDGLVYRYYENIDGLRFSEAIFVPGGPDVELSSPDLRALDFNGDGYRDLVQRKVGSLRYFPGGNVDASERFLGWPEPRYIDTRAASGIDYFSEYTRLSDVNNDGRIDILHDRPGFGPERQLINRPGDRLVAELIPEFAHDFSFGDSRNELADLNGDGQLDLIRQLWGYYGSRLRVMFGRGNGLFAPERRMTFAPEGMAQELHLVDVNRDGQADVVRLSGQSVSYYLNRGGDGFTRVQGSFYPLPATWETSKREFLDMNGNGTTDIVWVNHAQEVYYLDLMDQPYPGLLSRVDSGTGQVTEIRYESSTQHRIRDRLRGDRWNTPLPLVVPVVTELTTTDSLDAAGAPATRTRTTFEYHNGYYDTKEREFRGFERVTRHDHGDSAHEGRVTVTHTHVGRNLTTGADEEALKGKPYRQTVSDEAGQLFTSQEIEWRPRVLWQEELGEGEAVLPLRADHPSQRLAPGQPGGAGTRVEDKDHLVCLAEQLATVTTTYERTEAPRFAAQTTERNPWGQPTRSVNLGEIEDPGPDWTAASLESFNPEAGQGAVDQGVVEAEYVNDTEQWLIGLPAAERTLNLEGQLYAETRHYYDGLDFVGLPLGVATAGLLTRSESWLDSPQSSPKEEAPRWVQTERYAYDPVHGQRTVSLDPTCGGADSEALGSCSRRTQLLYDAETATFVERERHFLPAGPVDFVATHDKARGLLTSLTDPNGHTVRVGYDGLGRVETVVDPQTSSELPLARFEYVQASPQSPLAVTTVHELRRTGGPASGKYGTRVVYSDSAGNTRLVKTLAEGSHGWVGSGFSTPTSLGPPSEVFEPFSATTAGFELPPEGTPATRSLYDALGRPLEVTPPAATGADGEPAESGSVRSVYLPFETLTYAEQDPGQQYPARRRLDGLGRLVEVELRNDTPQVSMQGSPQSSPQALVWALDYDPLGNLVELVDPGGHPRSYAYDSLSRLTGLTDPSLGSLSYAHDDAGRLTLRADGLQQRQRFGYDSAGRLESAYFENQASGQSNYHHRYLYDAADPEGPLPGARNLTGRLSRVEYPTGERHLSYDANGRIEHEARLTWDGASPFEEQSRTPHLRSFQYNPDDSLRSQEEPNGFRQVFGYDARGQLAEIQAGFAGSLAPLASGLEYDARGALSRIRYGNGTQGCRAYDERGRVTARFAGAQSADCSQLTRSSLGPQQLLYTWGLGDRLLHVEDLATPGSLASQSATYQYDQLQQLVRAEHSAAQFAFSYDGIQNLTSRTSDPPAAGLPAGEFNYGESGAPPNALTGAGGQHYSYDALGQLEALGSFQLHYDGQGRLSRAVSAAPERTLEFHYDERGHRTLARILEPESEPVVYQFPFESYQLRAGDAVTLIGTPGGTIEATEAQGLRVDLFLLDELNAYVSAGSGGERPLPAEYLDLDGDGDSQFDSEDLALATAAFTHETLAGGPATLLRYYHPGHLGAPALVTDSEGEAVAGQRFHPFGELSARRGSRAYLGYAGSHLEPDRELGLTRMGARYYAPALGRWATPDRFIGENPDKMLERLLESNLYSYARNNPAMLRDPSGQQAIPQRPYGPPAPRSPEAAATGYRRYAVAVAATVVVAVATGAAVALTVRGRNTSVSSIVPGAVSKARPILRPLGSLVKKGATWVGRSASGLLRRGAARGGARNIANGPRLAAQLTRQEAASAFTKSGALHPEVIAGARPVIQGTALKNQGLVSRLTADGSNIADWAKMSTQSIKSPSGPFQVHFYQNLQTGAVHYGDDFKAVFNHGGNWP